MINSGDQSRERSGDRSRGWLVRRGPGMMIAATAVGVSHLVQSTRAGADFGFGLAWAIVAIVLLKYPAFRFAAEYTARTGRSLVAAYAGIGRIALAWLVFAMMIEMFVGTSAVALVTAGLLAEIFGTSLSAAWTAIVLLVLTAIILVNGRYARVERFVKSLVLLFSVLTVVTTAAAVPILLRADRSFSAWIEVDLRTLAFIVAMTGWMPVPVAVSAFHSVWVREKVAASHGDYTRKQAIFDLNIGWTITLLLALCFVVMGTAVLFQSGASLPQSAPEFAALLFTMFTALTGSYVYPLLAAAGLAAIWSTLIAIMDAVPRLMDRVWQEALPGSGNQPGYRVFLAAQVAGASTVLLVFPGNFGRFIDFAASTGFLVAPAMALFNYRALRTATPAGEPVAPAYLVVWHWAALATFVVCAALFFVIRFA